MGGGTAPEVTSGWSIRSAVIGSIGAFQRWNGRGTGRFVKKGLSLFIAIPPVQPEIVELVRTAGYTKLLDSLCGARRPESGRGEPGPTPSSPGRARRASVLGFCYFSDRASVQTRPACVIYGPHRALYEIQPSAIHSRELERSCLCPDFGRHQEPAQALKLQKPASTPCRETHPSQDPQCRSCEFPFGRSNISNIQKP